jgi:hypothetical protein
VSIGVLVGEELERKDDVVIADMDVALVVDKEKVWPEVKRVETSRCLQRQLESTVGSEFSELQAAAAPISFNQKRGVDIEDQSHKKNK